MRGVRLGALLTGPMVGLALLAVAGLAIPAAALLRGLADDQALARARYAALRAQRSILDHAAALEISARLLAERPDLARLLVEGDRDRLASFLARFRETGGLGAVAILTSEGTAATSGEETSWPPRLEASLARGWFVRTSVDGSEQLVAYAPIPGRNDAGAAVAIRLEKALTVDGDDASEITTRVLSRWDAVSGAVEARSGLRTRTAHDGVAVAQRLRAAGLYYAAEPLRAHNGDVFAIVEAEVPATGVSPTLRRFMTRLVVVGLGVAALAIAGSILLARRIALPLGALTRAAERIGGGDLATPVPRQRGVEIATLAETMDGMRARLLHLTADLEAERAETKAVIHGIAEGVFTVDRERRLRWVNPQAAALLGISSDAAIGRFCGDVLDPRPVAGVRPCDEDCPILHARFRGEARATEHLQLRDGRVRTVVVTSAKSGENRQSQVLRDETDVEAARRTRDAILANISHEFKTPLAAQLASIELLLDRLDELPAEEVRRLVQALQRGTLRLTQLIDNLLESVRIEAGEATLRRQSVQLDEIVEDAVEMVRPLLDLRGQTVDVDLPHPLPSIPGDPTRLVQLFVNLVVNAGKFSPDHSPILIGGKCAEDAVQIWVEDRGPGWPEEDDGLFRPFVRSTGAEPEPSGMGLGLYIVKSVAERHGGRVGAGPAPGGSGARVTVTLPTGEGA